MDEQGDLATQETTQDQPQDLRSVLESAIEAQEAPAVEQEAPASSSSLEHS